VSSGGARRGRRDNGLTAAAYAVVADVDPRIGEHLLDVLGLAGIAAYLQPASDLHPVTRTTTLPATPTDRLFVDRNHVDTARGHLDTLLAGTGEAGTTRPAWSEPADAEVDAAWARIVAGYALEAPDPTGGDLRPDGTQPPGDARPGGGRRTDGADPDPTHPDAAHRDATHDATDPDATDPEEPPGADPAGGARILRRADPATTGSLLDALDTFGAGLPDEPEEGYTPPPPPPLPRPSAAGVLGVAGVLGGLALMIWPDLVPLDAVTTVLLAVAMMLGGAVTLIWRLRPGDDESDPNDPDDGAVV
jgi:hypothetical protein